MPAAIRPRARCCSACAGAGRFAEISGRRHRHRHSQGQARRDLRGVPAPRRSRRRAPRAMALGSPSCGRISRLLDHPVHVRSQVGQGLGLLRCACRSARMPPAEPRGRSGRRACRSHTHHRRRARAGDRQRGAGAGGHDQPARYLALPGHRRTPDAEGAHIGARPHRGDSRSCCWSITISTTAASAPRRSRAIRQADATPGIPARSSPPTTAHPFSDDVDQLAGVSLLLKPIKPARLRALIASVRE